MPAAGVMESREESRSRHWSQPGHLGWGEGGSSFSLNLLMTSAQPSGSSPEPQRPEGPEKEGEGGTGGGRSCGSIGVEASPGQIKVFPVV